MPQSSVGGRKAPVGAVPFRDRQQETPRFFCAQCGQEQYTYDPPAVAGLCPQCRRRNRQREENAMTLQEMSVEYRAQARVLQGRIEALKQTQDTLDHGAARDQMALRIQTLQTIWRETRDLAVLLEHYYERGYRRNARYTL